jgi:hypothetical protein
MTDERLSRRTVCATWPIWGDRYMPNLNRAASPNASDMFVNPSYDPESRGYWP